MSATSGVEELDRDRLVWMYEQMLRIREFEERVKRTFVEHPGVIRGHTHLADGAEASIVGSIATLGPEDQFFATYRCHGYPLARGTDPKAMMAEIYGRKDGLCKGIGGSMHLADPATGFLGTSGIVAAGIPHATGAAWAAQIRKQGQVVLCFFGDGASKQGAFSESLNIASLWKLPIVYVMENNGYNVHTRTEQEDANRANGEDLSVKAKAFSMPGVTIDGRDPIAVYETVGAAVARARAGEGPTLVESQMYRLSAHGNIIAPPGVPLHFPEHEAIEKFGAPEEYEAALKGDPVPAFRGRLIADGMLSAAEADDIAEAVREEMQAAVTLRPRQSLPRRRDSPRVRLRLGGDRFMAHELPFIAAIDEAIRLEMERDDTVLYFGQNMATTENEPYVDAFGKDRVRVTPISETAEIGMAIGAALAGFRPVVELYMAEFMLVAMDQVINEAPRFRAMSGGQVKVPLVLKAGFGFTAGWAGQHTGTIGALFMGVPGLKVVMPSTAADAKGLMATAIRDDNPVVYLHHYLLTLEHGEVPDGEYLVPVRRGRDQARGRRRDDRRHGLDGRSRARRSRAAGLGGDRGGGDRPAHACAARHADDPGVGRQDRPAGARRPGDAARIRLDGDRRRGRRARVLVAEGADRPGHRARRDDPVQRAARGLGPARRGQDRHRRAAGARVGARNGRSGRRAGREPARDDVADPPLRGAGRRARARPARSRGWSI